MSITIHLKSLRAADDASAGIESPTRCGAVNFANVNARAVLAIIEGREPYECGELPYHLIPMAIERIGAALDNTDAGMMRLASMQSPANDHPPSKLGARLIMQPQTAERARERLAAMLVLLSIALARGDGLVWS